MEASREEQLNGWYNQEHIPDVLRLLPGCLGAARYRVVDGDGSHQYMAVYAFASETALRTALQGDEIKEQALRPASLTAAAQRHRAGQRAILRWRLDGQ